jgi:hypothetical protein
VEGSDWLVDVDSLLSVHPLPQSYWEYQDPEDSSDMSSEEDDYDSNDESNWRNNYPDSDQNSFLFTFRGIGCGMTDRSE